MQSSLYAMAGNANEALEAVNAALSPRARELETLERYAMGTQYEGLADWFDDKKPIWERAPCIVYLQTKCAIQSNVDLVLGESRFPVVTSNPGEDDSANDGLSEEQSEAVDRAITEVCARVRFRSASRSVLKHGQQAKSVAAIFGARKGRPFVEIVRSRWCEPTFDECREVVSLEIRYPYVDWQKQPDGKWKLSARLYRRVIDATTDTTYLPIDCDKSGREPHADAWKADPSKTVAHGLGFCPVVWYAHMRESTTVADYDGEAIHQNSLDEIRGLDFALSQKHRAALFCGDPQIVETGVEPGTNPSGQSGRTASVPQTKYGGAPSAENPVTGRFAATGGDSARVKSPGVVWTYESAEAKVSYLVLPEYALASLDTHAADLRNKIAEDLCTVILDPQNLKLSAALSGKAIEQLRSRQFDRCDQIRDDVGDGWILPAIKMILRVVMTLNLPIKAVQSARASLAKFIENATDAPMLFIRWPGSYVKPDPADEVATVTATTSAKAAGLLTRKIALQKVAPIFCISSLQQAEDALDKEKAESDAQEAEGRKHDLALAHATMGALNGGDKPGAKPKPADEG